jgi:hypothetical protein
MNQQRIRVSNVCTVQRISEIWSKQFRSSLRVNSLIHTVPKLFLTHAFFQVPSIYLYENKLQQKQLKENASRPRFDLRSHHVGFLMDKVALGHVFSEYFSLPYQFSFHQMLHIHPSSGAGTIGYSVADVPSGLSLTPPPMKLRKVWGKYI